MKKTIKFLKNQPELFDRMDPPAGYERILMHKIQERIQPRKPSLFARFSEIMTFRIVGPAAGFAVILLVFSMSGVWNKATQSETGVFGQIVDRGGDQLVNNWIASNGSDQAHYSDDVVFMLSSMNSAEAKVVAQHLKGNRSLNSATN